MMKLTRRTLLAVTGASSLCASDRTVAAADLRRLLAPLAAEPAGLIPGLNQQPACRMVGTKLYQGLVRFSPAFVALPELAAGWTVSADRRAYTFNLRPGVTWHDGAPFTAADVAFSIDRFHRALSAALAPVLANITAVQAPDDRTVVVRLAEPFEGLLFALDAAALPIVPRHIHDQPGWALDPRQTPPVGTGPFQMASWLHLARFAGFAGVQPGLDEIVFTVLPDSAGRLAATRSGQPVLLAADALTFDAIPRLRQQGMLVTGEVTPNHAGLAWLDLKMSTPFTDERVRRALACAVDRAAVLRDVWAGFGQVASGPVPLAGFASPDPALPAYDLREASALLNAAGLQPDEQGIRLRLRHLVPAAAPWPSLAAVLQRALGQVGIEVTPEIVSPAVWAERVAAGDYETTGRSAEYSGDAFLDPQARRRSIMEVAQIWLVEPAIPVARDRRLQMPGGVYSSFADATFTA